MQKNHILGVFIIISGVITGLTFGYNLSLEKNVSSNSKMFDNSTRVMTLVLYTDDFVIPPDNEQQIMNELPSIIELMRRYN